MRLQSGHEVGVDAEFERASSPKQLSVGYGTWTVEIDGVRVFDRLDVFGRREFDPSLFAV